jgi:hypothetical protein
MKHNMGKMMHKIGYPIPIDKRNRLPSIIKRSPNVLSRLRNLSANISIYEFEPKTPNEKCLWNLWKQTENRNKILHWDGNSGHRM